LVTGPGSDPVGIVLRLSDTRVNEEVVRALFGLAPTAEVDAQRVTAAQWYVLNRVFEAVLARRAAPGLHVVRRSVAALTSLGLLHGIRRAREVLLEELGSSRCRYPDITVAALASLNEPALDELVLQADFSALSRSKVFERLGEDAVWQRFSTTE